jgi:ATP-dependent Lon protease
MDATPEILPMFPLNAVLFPGVAIPLHVFEPRYRALTRHCLDTDRRFGVVLIERGSEVGGGDVRFDVGTCARIVEADELPDGRWVLVAVGAERLRVARWLPDDPYPRAEVEVLVEASPSEAAVEKRVAVERLLRRALALQAEMGESAPPATVEFDPDAVVASYQMAAVAPLGPIDRQRVLERDGVEERLDALAADLTEAVDVLAKRASGG